ncbi:Alpha/beta hydrolase fold-1 [Paraphoma chrysanthemicola]|uniref:Alpha/beta hydrolase fold-1 n=1 Tax=Paraphoma chrysanthemicola TaxID=798071 RepID=A0A8K0QWG1_9PLEO|nr:Alpha/beta hydrolase fold-1 [Paraphoma chrysanthemicola]
MAPTLVIVPGSFCPSEVYDPVLDPLRQKGYSIHALDPPCYPKNYAQGKPAPTMYDDAEFVSRFVQTLADKGEDVVILSHSYGGIPATEALKGLTKTERSAQGKKGGVTHVAYLTALVPEVGGSLGSTLKGGAAPLDVDDGWLRHSEPAETAKLAFTNLPAERGIELAANLGRHSATCFSDGLTHPGYRDVSVSWGFCEEDICVTPEVQQTAIDVIEASWKGTEREGQKVDVTKLKVDHMPMYSAAEETTKWVEGLFTKG